MPIGSEQVELVQDSENIAPEFETPGSKRRIVEFGEVFTPPQLVNDMLDLVAHECARIESRFLEPACGNGNFLAEVLRRKLNAVHAANPQNRSKWERDSILACTSIYGIDLLADNVAACRDRMRRIVEDEWSRRFKECPPDTLVVPTSFILSRNIVHGDALTLRTSSGGPIIFSEWSFVSGTMVKRRDFAFGHLVDHSAVAAMPLFSDLGEDVFVPTPVCEFPICHYHKISEAAARPQATP